MVSGHRPPVLSIVIPAYNEAAVIDELYHRLYGVLKRVEGEHEIIFVNDGSHDATIEKLIGLHQVDRRVKVLSLSRNFGHQLAITAGMDYASGEAVIVLDADLQDPPEVIEALVEKWRAGFDIVYPVRARRRGDTLFKERTARLFYWMIQRLTDVPIPRNAGDFRLMSRRVLEQMKSMRERHRFVRGMVAWVGFRSANVLYYREPRYAGITKYPIRRMLRFAVDAIVSFSDKPLKLATALGLSVSALSFLGMIYFVVFWFFGDRFGLPRPVPGLTSGLVAMFFLGGVQLICLGIIGEYLGRLYDEVKQRPLYVVAEEIGFSKD